MSKRGSGKKRTTETSASTSQIPLLTPMASSSRTRALEPEIIDFNRGEIRLMDLPEDVKRIILEKIMNEMVTDFITKWKQQRGIGMLTGEMINEIKKSLLEIVEYMEMGLTLNVDDDILQELVGYFKQYDIIEGLYYLTQMGIDISPRVRRRYDNQRFDYTNDFIKPPFIYEINQRIYKDVPSKYTVKQLQNMYLSIMQQRLPGYADHISRGIYSRILKDFSDHIQNPEIKLSHGREYPKYPSADYNQQSLATDSEFLSKLLHLFSRIYL